jgi:hypothetical protein
VTLDERLRRSGERLPSPFEPLDGFEEGVIEVEERLIELDERLVVRMRSSSSWMSLSFGPVERFVEPDERLKIVL